MYRPTKAFVLTLQTLRSMVTQWRSGAKRAGRLDSLELIRARRFE